MSNRIPTPDTSDSEEVTLSYTVLKEKGVSELWIAYILQSTSGQEERCKKYQAHMERKQAQRRKKREEIYRLFDLIPKELENERVEDEDGLSLNDEQRREQLVPLTTRMREQVNISFNFTILNIFKY